MKKLTSVVSKEMRQMLVVGKRFNITGRFERQGTDPVMVFNLDVRFLGIDADTEDRMVWLFSSEWMEEGFPTCRVERLSDAVVARTTVVKKYI